MVLKNGVTGTNIHEEPLEIGGHTVISYILSEYHGPCAVWSEGSSEKLICAFPSFFEARRAARYATTPDGGYGSVIIMPCSVDDITHAEFVDWAF